MRSHSLPILGTDDVKKPVCQPLLHGSVEDIKKLCPNVRLDTAEARQEGRLQLRGQFSVL